MEDNKRQKITVHDLLMGLMKDNGIDINILGQRLGISVFTLDRYITGSHKDDREYGTIEDKVKKAFGVDDEYFYGIPSLNKEQGNEKKSNRKKNPSVKSKKDVSENKKQTEQTEKEEPVSDSMKKSANPDKNETDENRKSDDQVTQASLSPDEMRCLLTDIISNQNDASSDIGINTASLSRWSESCRDNLKKNIDSIFDIMNCLTHMAGLDNPVGTATKDKVLEITRLAMKIPVEDADIVISILKKFAGEQ